MLGVVVREEELAAVGPIRLPASVLAGLWTVLRILAFLSFEFALAAALVQGVLPLLFGAVFHGLACLEARGALGATSVEMTRLPAGSH